MTPYREILCPVDFSDVSRRALEWSLGFARDVGARVSVLHVMDTELVNVGNLAGVPNIVSELRQRAEEALDGWKRELDLSGTRVELTEGEPAEKIVAASARKGLDLLVMGTHGLSGIQKLLLGSVTEKVLHRSHVPLLTISARSPGESPEGFSRPRSVVMGIDFGDEAECVVRHGVWLAEHFRARLVAAHAVPVPYVVLNDKTLERLGPEELGRLTSSLTEESRKELRELLPESASVEMQVEVRVGSPFDTLRELVRENAGDLIVMGAGGHGEAGVRWLGSTCHKMVRAASCPVLIAR